MTPIRRDVPPAQVPPGLPTRVRSGSWTLELPFVRALSLNDRMNYWVKAAAVKEWRKAAFWLAKAAKVPPCSRVRIELHYVPRTNQRRDVINLMAALKPLEDGLVDAGVVPDDTPAYIEPTLPVIHPKGEARPGGGRFWLEVTAL